MVKTKKTSKDIKNNKTNSKNVKGKNNTKKTEGNSFRDYFSVVTRIVYTLSSISDRNDMTKRLSNNIDKVLGYEDEINLESDRFSNDEEVQILLFHLQRDLKMIKGYKEHKFNIERFIEEHNLSQDEIYILYCMVVYSIYGDPMSAIPLRKLLELITFDTDIYINKAHYFNEDSPLIRSGLFVFSKEPYSQGGILEVSHTLISFINSKVLFAFIEKAPYEVISSLVDKTKEVAFEDIAIKKKFDKSSVVLTPKEIVRELDKSVIGQEKAKKVLAVHAHLHCLRMNGGVNIPFRSNIMMIGPTGVGKTFLVKTLSEILNIPFARADVTTLTETGYVGDDVEVVLYDLYRKAKGDLQLAEHGIVFLDEVDKIAKADAHQSTTGNPSDKAVQEALLSIMNGEDVRVPEYGDRRMMHSSEGIVMNTKNILFIFGGAFVGLDDIVRTRLRGDSSLGFGSATVNKVDKARILEKVDVKDIEKYGMIPEFIGRIPIFLTLNELTKEDLKNILLKASDSPIIKYREFFKSLGKELVVTDDAINYIVDKASSYNMGARSLKSIVETAMVSIIYNLDGITGNTLTLTKKELESAYDTEVNSTEKNIKNKDSIKQGSKDEAKIMA